MKYIVIAICLMAGNFLYQALHAEGWAAAVERSFFQAVAVLAVWLSDELS